MTWSPTLHCQFADEATARRTLAAIGVEWPAGATIFGDQNYVVSAPIVEWDTPPARHGDGTMTDGVARAGYWLMLRLFSGWDGYDAAQVELQPYIVRLNNPTNVFLE